IATIQGTVEPDRWVMIGNHRDAWVYGAVDPGSGTAATLETCRAIGAAVKSGWKPRRTLVYASWDAEEYGLVGSTEWADEHAKELDVKAALLLNVDSAVGGQELDIDGVPSLRDFMLDATEPAIDVGFAGRYGVYHSIYDNFHWMEKFCDPEFLTHATAAKLYTVIAMRAAGAEVLPLKFTAYGEALRDHLDDLRRIIERRARAV